MIEKYDIISTEIEENEVIRKMELKEVWKYDELKKGVEKEIGKEGDIIVIECESLRDLKKLKNRVGKEKIIFVKCDNIKALRKIIEKRECDAILDIPQTFPMFQIDEVIIKRCKENNISLVFSFTRFLGMSKKEKMKYLRNMRKILQLCWKYDVWCFPVSMAKTKWEIRDARDLQSWFYITYRNPSLRDKVPKNIKEFFYFCNEIRKDKKIYAGVYIEEKYIEGKQDA